MISSSIYYKCPLRGPMLPVHKPCRPKSASSEIHPYGCSFRLVWCVSFRDITRTPRDCKALPHSHLCCTRYAARHAAVWVMPSCFPDGGVQCVAAMGAGRLDWKLQVTALLRK